VEATTTTPGSSAAPGVATSPVVPTTIVPQSTTGTASSAATTVAAGTTPGTTTSLAPTTTPVNYCPLNTGMSQPLTFTPGQVTSDQTLPSPSTLSNDIAPTPDTTGVTFPHTNPTINVTFSQPANVPLVYLPNNPTGETPNNVNQFTVTILYPNGTVYYQKVSVIPSSSGTTTTTPSTSAISTTTPTTSAVVLPTDTMPQVPIPPNYPILPGMIMQINIPSTSDNQPPRDVCHQFCYLHQ
jgi:hypothetical protein